ncbi:hypothetical protein CsatB_013074 [Cannabis sativa]
MQMMNMNVMEVKVKERSLVKPADQNGPPRPINFIPLSDLDLIYEEMRKRMSTCLYFYNKPNQEEVPTSNHFFDPSLLKKSLAKVLVPFYPIAGRLGHDHNRRLQINCNDDGVLFVVAETSSHIHDLGDFTSSSDLSKLSPPAPDYYSTEISSIPLLALQVTYFGCGGICLSVGGAHVVMDGNSAFDFVNAWSQITRAKPTITTPPVFDRTLLSPRNPPQILFDHTKDGYRLLHQPNQDNDYDDLNNNNNNFIKVIVVKITKDQLNALKLKANNNLSTFSILAGLIWKCTCMARELPKDEETKLSFSSNGRSKLKPPLPLGYFGNVVFENTTTALVGDLQSKPFWYASNLVQETLTRNLENEYLKSVIDFLKVHPNTKRRFEFGSPNLGINSWSKFSIYDADFGWGPPFLAHCGAITNEGRSWIFDNNTNNGDLSVYISLYSQHVEKFNSYFKNLLNQI